MRLKKFTAALTSLIIACSAAALPVSNTACAYTNIISNSTFDSGISGWSMYKESGGAATLSSDNGRLALKIDSVGKLTYSLQMCYDIIPLYKNGVYRFSYDISSTADRYVEAMIQMNGGDYRAYTWKGIDLTSTPQTINYEFTMKDDTDIMSKFCINCGNEEKDAGKNLGQHTIYLDNVVLELVDDSKVDYSEIRAYEPPIVVNQVGYKPNDTKKAVIRRDSTASHTVNQNFSVVNSDTKAVVYTGTLSNETNNSGAGETDWIADFSSVKTPGKYYVKIDGLDDSYTFEISENPYKNLLDDTVRMLYLQRCGTEIKDNEFGHAVCHNTKAKVYGTNEYIDVSGGWHDAGDYGRYVVPAAKTIADLLNAYDLNPDMFSDSIGIPESGNGIPDVLDEVKYDLDWLFKMQDQSTGGVHHKVTCESFPGYIMPEKETDELIVTPVSTTATADFCGAMAMAYKYFEKIDKNYADKCLAAAEKAWTFLEQNPNMIFKNPDDITTGDYGDKSDTDERWWAAAQLYSSTGKSNYLTYLENTTAKIGMDWALVGDYGNIAILKMDGIDKTSAVYTKAKNAIVSQAKTFAKNSDASPYGVALTKFNWGSNMTVANAGVILALASELENNDSYLENAKSNLNYLLGENPNGVCFVTGYGTVSPQNPHHRPSMAKGTAMKGMLVGGVNSALEDSAAKAYLNGVSPYKCYVDHSESYSTNEITTYWNSPLIYLLAVTNKNSSSIIPSAIKGDVNGDGNVNIADIIKLQQYMVKKTSLSSEQLANADMDGNGTVNIFDVILLRRKVLNNSGNNNHDTPQPIVTTAPNPVVTTTTTTTIITTTTVQDNQSGPDQSADMVADFRNGESRYFYASDGWSNESCFNCTWFKENTSFSNGALNLTIDKASSGSKPYSAAEYRTNDFYGYGYYETSMQAIKNDGVVSSFFTYTGPSDNNPWDEIDIEVLGKDTTKVQFNYYTNGVGNHEYMYDLGFDASQGFHTYGFDWQPDHITWYVDGKAVYTATSNIPSTPGRIMMNVWPGITVDDWLNPFNGNTPLTAKYQWVTFKK